MSRPQLVAAARAELARRQQRAETEALARREEIYAALPALASLDAKKAEAGVAAARFAADGQHEKAGAKLAEMHDVAQRRRQLLEQSGLSEEDLQPRYSCAVCGDTGLLPGGSSCACLTREIHRLRRDEVNLAGPLRLCRFENFTLDYYPETLAGAPVSPRTQMDCILADCREYARDFGPHSGGLLMYGDAGLGKTHLALSIASEVLDKGFDVLYVSAQSAFSEISERRYDGGPALLHAMIDADLLVLDDLGTEFLDAYVLSRLYELVNARLRKPTVYTTNICKREQLEQRYTEKIASRLLGECRLMRFFGKDIRLLK